MARRLAEPGPAPSAVFRMESIGTFFTAAIRTCSVITPPGTLRQLNRTSCPSMSSATAVNSIRSPVAALKKGRKPVIVVSPASPGGSC
jgi:hypothetical protein